MIVGSAPVAEDCTGRIGRARHTGRNAPEKEVATNSRPRFLDRGAGARSTSSRFTKQVRCPSGAQPLLGVWRVIPAAPKSSQRHRLGSCDGFAAWHAGTGQVNFRATFRSGPLQSPAFSVPGYALCSDVGISSRLGDIVREEPQCRGPRPTARRASGLEIPPVSERRGRMGPDTKPGLSSASCCPWVDTSDVNSADFGVNAADLGPGSANQFGTGSAKVGLNSATFGGSSTKFGVIWGGIRPNW